MHTNRDNNTVTPYQTLIWAIDRNLPDIASAIIKNPNMRINNNLITTAMLVAYEKENLACAKAIVASRREDLGQSGCYDVGLHKAVQIGDAAFVELLLKQGAETSWFNVKYKTTPLHEAIASKADHVTKMKMIDLLVSYGAELDPPENITIPFTLAAEHWRYLIALVDKTNQGDYNKTRYGRVLYQAVSDGNLNAVTRILKANVDKDWQHYAMKSNTYLHEAVNRCNPEMIGLLLSFDCNPNIKNDDDKTPREMVILRDIIWGGMKMQGTIAAGWQNHSKRENLKLRDTVTTIVQSNCKSGFFKLLPQAIVETQLIPYLRPKFIEETTTLASTAQHVSDITGKFQQVKTSAQNFLKEYKSFHIGSSSQESKKMADDIQYFLDQDQNRPARNIHARVNRFFKENTDKCALALLKKHGLAEASLPADTAAESKQEFSGPKKK
ncbi:MAG TPA: hypothetical protein VLI69_08660 [Gammaproteobacteria bacterium]|nr:hypothetical protein [Gammaproteobacteria bacterium]